MTGTDILEYEKRAKKGIKFLDKTYGRKKWVKKTNLKILDLGSANKCILGEVMGDFNDYGDIGLDNEKIYSYGFCLQEDEKAEGKYPVLTAVWIGLLRCMGKR